MHKKFKKKVENKSPR